MSGNGRKNKRGDRGSLEEGDLNDAKRPNMAARGEEETTKEIENPSPEPSLAEIKDMLAEIQRSVASTLKEEDFQRRINRAEVSASSSTTQIKQDKNIVGSYNE